MGLDLWTIIEKVVLIGAGIGGLTVIVKTIVGPTKFFRKKRKEKEQETAKQFKADVKEVLHETIPKYFADHKVESDKQFQEIKDINKKQCEQIELLNGNLKDILREKIMAIYEKYRNTQEIPVSKKLQLDQYFKDYRKQNGNSFICDYYNIMCGWTVIPDDQTTIRKN